MGVLKDLMKAVSDMVTGGRRQGDAPSPDADAEDFRGQFGPDASVEVDPRRIGRGKDRPVLVVAVESAGTYLAVQLTSKDHDGAGDFVSIGAGGWDGEHRPSWVNLDRVIRVHTGGMRREASVLPREAFEQVEVRLQQRYGWR